MRSEVLEVKSRWPAGPQVCMVTNLPGFETEAELKAWMAKDCPRCRITFTWKCKFCHGWHHHAEAPNPSGDSSGTGRSHK